MSAEAAHQFIPHCDKLHVVRTESEIAWAAGLFEGEGNLTITTTHCNAGLVTTDKDVLERFRTIVGFGSIYHRTEPSRPSHYKPQWLWRATSARDTLALIELFRPWFGERRSARADEVWAQAKLVGSRGRSKHQTHCIRGHEFTEENTYRQPNAASPKGWTRQCRICNRERNRERRSRKKVTGA